MKEYIIGKGVVGKRSVGPYHLITKTATGYKVRGESKYGSVNRLLERHSELVPSETSFSIQDIEHKKIIYHLYANNDVHRWVRYVVIEDGIIYTYYVYSGYVINELQHAAVLDRISRRMALRKKFNLQNTLEISENTHENQFNVNLVSVIFFKRPTVYSIHIKIYKLKEMHDINYRCGKDNLRFDCGDFISRETTALRLNSILPMEECEDGIYGVTINDEFLPFTIHKKGNSIQKHWSRYMGGGIKRVQEVNPPGLKTGN